MNSRDPAVRTSKSMAEPVAMTTTKTAIFTNTTDNKSVDITREQQHQQRNNSRKMINILPQQGAQESNVTTRRRSCRSLINIAALRKQRSHFSTRSISIAFISYIIFNQLFMTVIISSSGIVLKGAQNSNMSSSQYKLSSFERSLVSLVAASPAPAPSPAALTRSTTSHRLPPMNGSIFGKRDLASGAATKHRTRESTTSEPVDYNDIITNVIEDFMARNNEVDPEETTVAFCRMIVYECHQVLANHSSKRRTRTKAPSQRSKSSSSG